MRFHHRAVVAALAIGAVAIVHGQWRDNGEEVLDTSWSKHSGEFGAMLLLSDKPEDFLETWDQPTDGVLIETTDTVARGVPIIAFVLFTGCAPDDKGLCNASVDFVILKPDGSEYDSFKDKDLWKNKPTTKKNWLQLSADYVGVIIEPDDPLGQYTVRVIARDLNANESLDLTQEFTATESANSVD